MYEKEKDLVGAFTRKQISRRQMMMRMGKLGVSAVVAHQLISRGATRAFAQGSDFNWRAHEGKTIKLLLNQHPYADTLLANLDAFKELTGMDVTYDIFPEDVYFDRVTAALSSGSSQYDAFMTGAYMTWTYGPAGWIVDLNEYIGDETKTDPAWDFQDFLPSLRASTAWDGVPGSALGSEGASQWCLPMGFELNNITYNQAMFDRAGLTPPANMQELMETAAKAQADLGGPYGIGVRGSRSWATIHPGFLSAYSNFGERDLNNENGMLSAAMNTPGSKQFHADWVKMIQDSGPRNWSTYTWYQVSADVGGGASAMMYDADIAGYFQNTGTQEAGNLAYAAIKPNPAAERPTPNVWIWALSMSNFANDKDATWYLMQWATSKEHSLFGAREMDLVNPVRASVWADQQFSERIRSGYPGYVEQFEVSEPGSQIYFTPQPLFFDLTTEWAAMLQQMVANQIPVDEGLDQLAESINAQLASAGMQ